MFCECEESVLVDIYRCVKGSPLNVSKSPGAAMLSPCVLKSCAVPLAEPLSCLFSICLPSAWKSYFQKWRYGPGSQLPTHFSSELYFAYIIYNKIYYLSCHCANLASSPRDRVYNNC